MNFKKNVLILSIFLINIFIFSTALSSSCSSVFDSNPAPKSLETIQNWLDKNTPDLKARLNVDKSETSHAYEVEILDSKGEVVALRSFKIILDSAESFAPTVEILKKLYADNKPALFLFAIKVNEPYQGKGIARLLTEYPVSIANELGVTRAYAFLMQTNLQSFSTAKKQSFSNEGAVKKTATGKILTSLGYKVNMELSNFEVESHLSPQIYVVFDQEKNN